MYGTRRIPGPDGFEVTVTARRDGRDLITAGETGEVVGSERHGRVRTYTVRFAHADIGTSTLPDPGRLELLNPPG